ncbi:hypothetical protein [Archaeoglobus sp.]
MPTRHIYLGRTWDGYEYLRIRKYKRKQGFKVDFVERRWKGGFLTRWTWQCISPDEVLENLRNVAGLEVSQNVVEAIRDAFLSLNFEFWGKIQHEGDCEILSDAEVIKCSRH